MSKVTRFGWFLSLSPSRRPPSSQDTTGGRVALPDLKKSVEQDSVGRKLVSLSLSLSTETIWRLTTERGCFCFETSSVSLPSNQQVHHCCPTILPSCCMTMSQFRDALFSSLGSVLVPHGKPTLPSIIIYVHVSPRIKKFERIVTSCCSSQPASQPARDTAIKQLPIACPSGLRTTQTHTLSVSIISRSLFHSVLSVAWFSVV